VRIAVVCFLFQIWENRYQDRYSRVIIFCLSLCIDLYIYVCSERDTGLPVTVSQLIYAILYDFFSMSIKYISCVHNLNFTCIQISFFFLYDITSDIIEISSLIYSVSLYNAAILTLQCITVLVVLPQND